MASFIYNAYWFLLCFLNFFSVFSDHFPKGKAILNGKELTALVYESPTQLYIKKLPNGSYTFEGMNVEVMALFKQYFNLSFTFIHLNSSEIATYGAEQAALRRLKSKFVDLIPMLIEQNWQSMDSMALMQPFHISDLRILQPYPNEESKLLTPIKPFTKEVWIFFLGSTTLLVLVLSTFAKLGVTEENEFLLSVVFKASLPLAVLNQLSMWENVILQLEYVVTIITSQGNCIRYSVRTAIRVLIAAWLLSMVVLVYAYTGVFTSIMTVPKLEPIVNSIEQLIANQRFKLTVDRHNDFTSQILGATSFPYKNLGDQLRQNPDLIRNDNFQTIDDVLRRDCVRITATLLANLVIKNDKKSSKKCRMTYSKPISKITSYQVGFVKDSPYAKIIDDNFALPLLANGQATYITNKYYPTTPDCEIRGKVKNNKPVSIKMKDLSGVFVLLIIGLSLSFLLLFMEVVHYWVYRNQNALYIEKKKLETSAA